jgi:hypothetical protein
MSQSSVSGIVGAESMSAAAPPLPADRVPRVSLDVAGIRVERLKNISEEDALAEGVKPLGDIGCPCGDMEIEDPAPDHLPGCRWGDVDIDPDEEPYRAGYRVLWDKINGKRAPWSSNPWVWVIDFTIREAHREA